MIAIENPSLSLKSSGLKAYDDMEALSFMSMEGIPTTPAPQEPSIDTFEALTAMLKPILHSSLPWQLKRDQIINLLGRLDLSTSEVNKVKRQSQIFFHLSDKFIFCSTHFGMQKSPTLET